MRQKPIYPYLLITPAFLLMFLVTLYPTLYSVYLSMNRVNRGALEFVGLRNFQVILSSGDFWESLRLTFIFGVFYVSLTLIFAFILALLFNRGLRFGGVYMTLVFIPWVLSEIVSGVIWRWMFYRDYGVLQNLIGPLFGGVTLMTKPAGAMGVVIGASVWQNTAYVMLLILAGLQTIPGEVYEAASIDGSTGWQAFWKITWPLVRPTTLVIVVLLTIASINAVGLFLSITEGGPGRATEVLSLHMYREALQFFHFGYGSALAVVMFFLNAILGFIYIRFLQRDNALAG
ncbi:MAG: sugar ABC transporter permease [Anaerolineae bacterium]|nr:sugar ABC transporter permease [Anaerolineae bacterium]